MRTFFLLMFLGVSLLFSATVEQMKSEKRYALVIANGLATETNDDKAVASAQVLATFLKSKGFTTVTAFNLDRAELIKTFRSFDKRITPNAVITLVYSGRTVVHDSQAWILPARMKLEGLPQLRLSAVSFDFLLQKLQRHTPRVSLGIVDAFRYSGKANTTDGELILDAVKDIKEADTLVRWNGKAAASPFFDHLLQAVGKGHDDMDALADKLSKAGVHSRIAAADFYFNVPAKLLTPADKAWQRAEAKDNIVGYEAFLIAYPDSAYQQKANSRIKALKAKEQEKVEAELKAQQETLARLKAEQQALAADKEAVEEAPRYFEPTEMVTIPEGIFLMGSEQFENSKPVHMVTVRSGLKMSAYEISNKAYAAFLKATGTQYRKKKLLKNESAAVAYVSWEDAVAYAEWLSKMSGKHYRLPTEAEWEYAARAGSDALYPWGDSAANAAQYAWMATNAHGFVHSRGLLQPNAFGLFDMAGNVAEWCLDGATPDYKSAPSKAGKVTSDNEAMKIIRGGSIKSSGEGLSPSYRDSNIPTFRSETIGFRLILEP
ncbi:SUMF1/EgtB/PvdO family nonheme iron enzyme [Thiomicrolovo sp. ZZH C-3]